MPDSTVFLLTKERECNLVLTSSYLDRGGGGGGTQYSFVRGYSAPRSKLSPFYIHVPCSFDQKCTPLISDLP